MRYARRLFRMASHHPHPRPDTYLDPAARRTSPAATPAGLSTDYFVSKGAYHKTHRAVYSILLHAVCDVPHCLARYGPGGKNTNIPTPGGITKTKCTRSALVGSDTPDKGASDSWITVISHRTRTSDDEFESISERAKIGVHTLVAAKRCSKLSKERRHGGIIMIET